MKRENYVTFTPKIEEIWTTLRSVGAMEGTDIQGFDQLKFSLEERDIKRLTFAEIKTLFGLAKKYADPTLYLHELIEDSEIILPKEIIPPRDHELELRIQKLKVLQAHKEYKSMTGNLTRKGMMAENFGSIGAEVRAMNMHLSTILNFVVTVAAAFAFGYKTVEYSSAVPNFGAQLSAGLILATVVFFADLYFVVKYEI